MSNKKNTISRKTIGELPVCIRIAEQLGFQDVLKKYIPIHHNESLNAVDALMLLVFNMACGRQPLYKVADWVKQCDAHLFEFDTHCVNDDRFARALDKLYQADRASIMTDVVTTMIKNLDITCDQIHNDSTSLKTTGHVPGKTKQGLEMKRGHSKDHRPDLKQLVYSLSITCDGAVPVHMKTYSGNRTDDTTHIETWNTLTKILNKKDFLYVADCKLCTDAQLTHITGHHGRAITVVPKSWKETKQFMDEQKKFPKGKTKIWSRPSYPGSPDDKDIIYAFDGSYASLKHAYPIHWYYSSNKREKDALSRQSKMQQMEKELNQLTGKNGKQTLKTKTQLSAFIETRLNHYKLTGLYDITIAEHHTPHQQKVGRGRPGSSSTYRTKVETHLELSWRYNRQALEQAKRCDGIFPLLCTDNTLSAKEVLTAYKYQPRLEKRFEAFKHVLNGAPLLFKKVERIEAIMFLFFIVLILYAGIERILRSNMQARNIEALELYPEHRLAFQPTTAKIFELFHNMCIYYNTETDNSCHRMGKDELNDVQMDVLNLLDLTCDDYWNAALKKIPLLNL